VSKASTRIPDAAREAVHERQRGQCLRCGLPYTEVHHRQPRRIGGHGLENLVGLCKTCHDYCHANPREARENGWIVSMHTRDIAAVPFTSWWGAQVLLDPDGTTQVQHC
jgi:hypothetical protein